MKEYLLVEREHVDLVDDGVAAFDELLDHLFADSLSVSDKLEVLADSTKLLLGHLGL
jgi:hypothetical protein